jgi:predicted outer membrane repeat protein
VDKGSRSIRLRTSIQIGLIAALAILGGQPIVRSQAPDPGIVWGFSAMAHLAENGCSPTVTVNSFDGVTAAWSQTPCGTRSKTNTGIRFGANQSMVDLACGTNVCHGLSGNPAAVAVSPDGNSIYYYAGRAEDGTYRVIRTRLADYASEIPATKVALHRIGECHIAPIFAAAGGGYALATSCGGGYLTLNGANVMGQSPDDPVAKGMGGSFVSMDAAGSDLVYYVDRGPTWGVYHSPGAGEEVLLATPHFNRRAEVSAVRDVFGLHIAIGGVPTENNAFEGGLVYARRVAGGYEKTVLDPISGRHPSIAVDPDGNVAIAYWREREMRLAWHLNGVWTNSLITVSATDTITSRIRLAFHEGHPIVAFYDPSTGDMMQASGSLRQDPAGTVYVTAGPGGTVTSSPAGISCIGGQAQNQCSASFGAGRFVTLAATPSTGARFVGWFGACGGQQPCVVKTGTAPTSLRAVFSTAGETGVPIVVNSTDGGWAVNDGKCTFHEAVRRIHKDPLIGTDCADGDHVLLPEGVFIVPGEEIRHRVTIIGAGEDKTILQSAGGPFFGVFDTGLPAPDDGELRLHHLTMRGGVGVHGGAVSVKDATLSITNVTFENNRASDGGAVHLNGGWLTVNNATFRNNTAGSGGAISGTGQIGISDSWFEGNTATADIGGALVVGAAGTTATVMRSTFTGNSAKMKGGAIANTARLTISSSAIKLNTLTEYREGGGIYSGGDLTVLDSTISQNTKGAGLMSAGTTFVSGSLFSNNQGPFGGGISAQGALKVVNSTFVENVSDGNGGGIYFDFGTTATLNNVTLFANRAINGDGGGLFRGFRAQSFTLSNTIAAGNFAISSVRDCWGEHGSQSMTSLGHNLIGNNGATCMAPAAGDLIGTPAAPIDPKFGGLEIVPNATPALRLLAGSPAIDAGGPATCEPVDQRGLARPQRAACDIGAYEKPNALPRVNVASLTTAEDTAVDAPLTSIDGDGDAHELFLSTPPANGTLDTTRVPFVYTPAPNFNGMDRFGVSARDIWGGVGDETTITVTVTPVNDPPTPATDAVSVIGNEKTILDPLSNDSSAPDSNETLIIQSVTAPSHGVATVTESGTRVSYEPTYGYVGADTFRYTVSDGNGGAATAVVNVTVTVPPVIYLNVEEVISVLDAPATMRSVMIDVTEAIGVLDTPNVIKAIMLDVTETISVSDAPDLVPQNTPPGTAVLVTPVDATTGSKPVTVKFGSVDTSGVTSVVSSGTGPAAPSGYSLGSPATFFEISTTAAYSGSIAVCISYSGVTFPSGTEPRLMHYEGGAWVDRTTSLDSANSTVCGTVSSLSPFAVFGRVTFKLRALYDEASPHKAGSAVPIKVQVLDASGRNVSAASLPVMAVSLRNASTGQIVAPDASGNANPGGAFRFDASLQGYIYNLKTTVLPSGAWVMSITINGAPIIYDARVHIR